MVMIVSGSLPACGGERSLCFDGIVMRYAVCSADDAEYADQGKQRQEQDAEHGDREELNEE